MIPARENFLRIHGVTAEAWAARYSIEPFTGECYQCSAALTTSLPFAVGELRGLMAPACECGDANGPYCVVRDPKHGDLLSGAALVGSKT